MEFIRNYGPLPRVKFRPANFIWPDRPMVYLIAIILIKFQLPPVAAAGPFDLLIDLVGRRRKKRLLT